MASSVLNVDETAIMASECNWCGALKGTLLATSYNRLAFVLTKGLFNKRYELSKWYRITDFESVRLEDSFFGKKLVMDHNKDGKLVKIEFNGLKKPEEWLDYIVEKLKDHKLFQRVNDEITKLVSSNEYTSFRAIYEDAAKEYPESYNVTPYEDNISWVINRLEWLLKEGHIDGFIDSENERFIHKVTYLQKTEVTNYNIATEFKFDSSSFIIKCPACGAESPSQKNSSVTCRSCGQTYRIPQKLLDRI